MTRCFPLRNYRFRCILGIEHTHEFIRRRAICFIFSFRCGVSGFEFPRCGFLAACLGLVCLVVLKDSFDSLRLVVSALVEHLLDEVVLFGMVGATLGW